MATAGSIMIYVGANTAGLGVAEKRARLFRNSMLGMTKSVGTGVSTLGRQLTTLSLPIAVVAGAAAKMFADFEYELAKVEGLVGISSTLVKQWGDDILELSPKVARMPKDLAEALYFVTSAGIRGIETMDVLEVSAKAAAAGIGTTKDAADAITSAMNAYGKENLNAAEASDILIMTIREGKVVADDLAKSIGKVFPIAAQLGVSFNEVGAGIAAMTRTGTPASTSAIYLRRVLSSMLRPTNNANEALQSMGGSFHDLRQTLTEDGGLLKAFIKIRKLVDDFGAEEVAQVFPNIRALIPVLDIIGKNLEDNKKIWENMLNPVGALDHAFNAVSKTFKHQWNAEMSRGNVAMIKFGETLKSSLLPIIRDVIGWVEKITDKWLALDYATQQMIIRTTLLVAAIGPLLLILGFLINVGLVPLTIAIKALLIPVKALMLLGMSAMFASWAVAIVVAAGAIMYMSKNFDSFAKKVNKQTGEMESDFGGWIDGMWTKTKLLGRGINLKSDINAIKEATKEWDVFAASITKTSSVRALDIYTQQFRKLQDELKAITGEDAIAEAARQSKLKQIIGSLDLMAQMRTKIIKEARKAGEIPQGMSSMVLNSINRTLKDAPKNIIQAYVEKGMYKKIGEEADDAISDFNKSFTKDVKDTFGGMFSWIKENAKGLIPDELMNLINGGGSGKKEDWAKDSVANFNMSLMPKSGFYEKTGGEIIAFYSSLKKLGNMDHLKLEDFFKQWSLVSVGMSMANKELANFGRLVDTISTKRAKLDAMLVKMQGRIGNISQADRQKLGSLHKDVDFEEFGMAMDRITADYKAFGSIVDITGEKQAAFNTLLQNIRAHGGIEILSAEELEKFKALRQELFLLQDVQTFLGELTTIVSGLGDIFSDIFGEDNPISIFFEKLEKGLSIIQKALNVFQAFKTIMDLVGLSTVLNTGVTTANTVATLTNTTAKTTQGAAIVGINSAVSASNAGVAISGAAAASSWVPFPGNIAAMAASVAGVMTSLSTIPAAMALTAAVGLKDGGIIPAGYEGDKFSANLNSNEAVIPLDTLWTQMRGMFGDGVGNGGKVSFHIDGYELAGVLEKQSKIHNAF